MNATAQFIINANFIHGNSYIYDAVNYVNHNTKVIIIFPIHGNFMQTPRAHLHGRGGCVVCAIN